MTVYIAEVLSDVQYLCLLSNCTKKSANNAQIEYKYLAILYAYLDSWSLISVLLKRHVGCARYACLFALILPHCEKRAERISRKEK